MNLIKATELSDFGWIRKELDRLTGILKPLEESENGGALADWTPAVDVLEEDDAITVTADLPQVEKKDIDVSVEDGILTIKGERKFEHEEKKKNYKRIERSYGSYVRRFDLPENVVKEKISAECKDGVLTVVLPKNVEAKTEATKISVN